ncbi:uncharacterized protein EV422DRAFT_562938 [Fimicolochytrium jonesii]|uniref:uncharacterized protein n=1 Tax=Fimicolochytrium jonesii TaxID=1396493 RepID=UPI0022FE925D|nr:uncharacterized protein EV422DRAFT_562938 [Fimicolochytrium jonesii]KAI8826874.1 hypothetical protein EV422DRAFT_562938 [Fimicolochytrium jonesii]
MRVLTNSKSTRLVCTLPPRCLQRAQHTDSTGSASPNSPPPIPDPSDPTALAHIDFAHLLTAPRFTAKPRRRPVSNTIHLAGNTVEALHDAFRRHNPRDAWNVYKQLFKEKKLHTLHPDDHSTMLGWLTSHTLPRLAAIHASRTMHNLRTVCGHQPDLRDYHALMLCQLRSGDYRRAVQEFHRMLDAGEKPDIRAYNMVLTAYGHARDWNGARAVWEEMARNVPGARADMDSWALMIENGGLCRKLPAALKLYEELSSTLRKPDRKIVEALIKAHAVARDLNSALHLFESIRDNRTSHPADLESYDAILHACETADNISRASTLWADLLAFCAQKSADTKQVVPLASTFTRMLALHARRGDVDAVTRLFDQRQKAYIPDLGSCQALVRALGVRGRWRECVDAYDAMVSRGHMPDPDVVRLVMEARRELGV